MLFKRRNRLGSLASLLHNSDAHASCFSNLEKLAVRLDDLQPRQKPDQDGNFRKSYPWENGARKSASLPHPCPGQPFRLSLEGVPLSLVPGRASSLNPEACYLLVGHSFLLLFPACVLISWRKQRSLVPASPLALLLFSAFTCPTPDWVVPTQSPKHFLIISYLCPHVWELHRDVYMGFSEDPRK